jgi:AraC-like DNA-binding protein
MYLEQIPLTERHRNESSIMNFILDYIAENYRNRITLKTVADALGYDYFYFSRIFCSVFGMHFNDYLNTYRFNAAVSLLLKTNLPITQVALESGFQSIRTFNDVFRRKTGSAPAEYRKQKKRAEG